MLQQNCHTVKHRLSATRPFLLCVTLASHSVCVCVCVCVCECERERERERGKAHVFLITWSHRRHCVCLQIRTYSHVVLFKIFKVRLFNFNWTAKCQFLSTCSVVPLFAYPSLLPSRLLTDMKFYYIRFVQECEMLYSTIPASILIFRDV
jgi:hypothetical protein